jgi:hypothetical protein
LPERSRGGNPYIGTASTVNDPDQIFKQ